MQFIVDCRYIGMWYQYTTLKNTLWRWIMMNKELSFEDDNDDGDDVYSVEDFTDDNDLLIDSQISENRFAEIIDEFEVSNDFYDNEEVNDFPIDLDSDVYDPLDLH